MTDVLLLLWLSDMADVARLFMVVLLIVTVAAFALSPFITHAELLSWKQFWRWLMIALVMIGVLGLIPSPQTLRIAAATVAAERSIDTEIGQQIKQAVLDALRGTAKEGEK